MRCAGYSAVVLALRFFRVVCYPGDSAAYTVAVALVPSTSISALQAMRCCSDNEVIAHTVVTV